MTMVWQYICRNSLIFLKVVCSQSMQRSYLLSCSNSHGVVLLHYSRVTKMWHWHDFPHLSLVKTNCRIDDVIAIATKSDCTIIEYKYGAIFSSIVIAIALDFNNSTKSAISKAIITAQNANKTAFPWISIFLIDFFFGPWYLEFIFANYWKMTLLKLVGLFTFILWR